MRFGDVIEDAVRGVRLHRVRSLLTAVGFAAGTAAAIALFAITGGARAEILRRLADLGIDLVVVRPVGEPHRQAPPALTYGDVEDLGRSLGFVREAAPVRAVESSVALPTERVTVRAIGTTPEFFRIRRLRFARGRSFTATEVARGDAVCVLGAGAARHLVAGGDAYGALVKIGGNWYRVIGLLTTEASGMAGGSGEQTNPERDVYLPITQTFTADALRRQELVEAWLAVNQTIDAEAAAPVIERALERRHEGRQHFEVSTAARLVAEHRATSGLLNRLLLLVCCAAFLLGAVAMTTVSWQNVRDRTREIAIRRAVGARRGEVLAQFLFEGIVVAAAGAAAGVVVGVAGSGIAAWANGWPWLLSPIAALVAIAVALGVAAVCDALPGGVRRRPRSSRRLEIRAMSEARRLGRYELLDVLGHGAMGVVYKAHDSFLDRIVAVKTYRQDVPITEDVKRRFEREVRTASKLNHPNIVVVYDGGLEQSVPYLAMEFVEGPTLAAELARHNRLPLDRALYIVRKVADGLAYAHARGVVHRDLKPANILLAGGTEPKIADFGVAKLMSSASATSLTAAVGTPSYMAPEQIDGRGVDARSDVFALGILAFELVTGRQPFVGEGWTAVMFQIMNVEPEPPTAIDASLPAAVDGVLARSLAKDPNDRTPDVITFAKELADALTPRAAPRVLVEHRRLRRIRMTRWMPARSTASAISRRAPASVRAVNARASARRRRWSCSRRRAGGCLPSAQCRARRRAAFATRHANRDGDLRAADAGSRAAADCRSDRGAHGATTDAAADRAPDGATADAGADCAPGRAADGAATRRAHDRAAEADGAGGGRETDDRRGSTRRADAAASRAASARAGKPTIDVFSEPAGAEVLVDGSVKGRTPLRISDLDPGSYRFEVRKEGRSPYRQTAELEANADYTMKVSLPIMVNSLRVLSQPDGVDIKLNGVAKGRTPLTLSQLPDGHYDVTGDLDGFEPQTLAIDLKDGELQEVRFSFGSKAPESH